MALQQSEGFDQVAVPTDLEERHNSLVEEPTFTLEPTFGPFGTQCLKCANPGYSGIRPSKFRTSPKTLIDVEASVIHAAWWYQCNSLGSTDYLIRISSSNASHVPVGIFLLSTGALETRPWSQNGGGGEKSVPDVIRINQWHHIEVAIRVSNTVGKIHCWVDGGQVLDQNGDTLVSNDGDQHTVDEIEFWTKEGQTTHMDDPVIWDETGGDYDYAGQKGPHKTETLPADGDSAVQFTPTGAGATNSDRVNEALMNDGDTTYVESSVIGEVDLYTLANQAATPPETFGVAVHTVARKTDVGTVNFHNRLVHNAAVFEGTDHFLTETYQYYSDYTSLNPDTGVQWGASDVDTLLAGIEFQG